MVRLLSQLLLGPVAALLVACGGSGSPDGTALTLAPQTVAGTLLFLDGATLTAAPAPSSTFVTVDDGSAPWPVGAGGGFSCTIPEDGDHSLFVHRPGRKPVEIACRILEGRGIDLGEVTIRDGRVAGHTGFDGYLCGFVDADGDGVNDQFRDADGDGICDQDKPYAGYPYMMNRGYQDANGDGVNDRFRDADGDGVNDVTGKPYVAMPGWVDLDGDGRNDFFRDANGDGINDFDSDPLPYPHGYGWADADHDGINDRFVDADGDGVNDYHAGPYADLHSHYGFRMEHPDAEGDGIDDSTGEPYCQGFGWVDADGDGMNDAFTDFDGDGVNDRAGPGGGMLDPGNWPGPGGRMR